MPGFAEYVGNGGLASGTTNVTVPLPTGWAADDIAFLVAEIGGTSGDATANTPPSGWTQHPASPVVADTGVASTRTILQVFWRRLVAGDTDPVVVGQTNHAIAIIHAFRGLPTTGDPWQTGAYGSAFSLTQDNSAALPGPGTAPTENNALVVYFVSCNLDQIGDNFQNWANAALTNVVERSDDFSSGGNGGGLGIATGELATATSYGSGSVDIAPNAGTWAAISLALRQGSGSTTSINGSGTLALPPITVAIGEEIVGTSIATLSNDGTGNWGNSPDRVLWWNGYQSRWDAVLPLRSPPAADDSDWWIVGNAGGTISTKVLVDGRTAARPTIVWDEPNKRLYVLMQAITGQGGSLIYAYNYNSTTDTYAVDSSVNAKSVGVNGTAGDTSTALGRTPNGYLWVASNYSSNGLVVNRSIDNGATWGVPVTLKATQADGKSAISYFTNAGTTYVCVASAENGVGAVPGPAVYHFLRIDAGSTGWGVAANWTDEAASLPALGGTYWAADDEIQLDRDSSENVYLTSETENIGGSVSTDPQWFVYRRTPDGTWTRYLIHGYDGGQARKRPTMSIDEAEGRLYVLANTDNNKRIVYRSAPLSSLGDLATATEYALFNDNSRGGVIHRNSHPPERGTEASDLLVLVDQHTGNYVARNLLLLPANTRTGTGTLSLPKIAASGTATRDAAGSGTLALPKIAASGVGGNPSAANATGTLSLPKIAASAAGDVDVAGSTGLALPKITAAGTGTVTALGTRSGSGTLTLPKIAVVGSGQHVATGEPIQSNWAVDLYDNNRAAIATDVPLSSLRVTWSLDGPGSFEAQIPEDLASDWLFGQRRVVVRRLTSEEFEGVLVELGEDIQSYDDLARPNGPTLEAAGLGLASVLETMVVHGDFSKFLTVATTIAWSLIQHAQSETDGNWGFSQGSTVGTAPARTKEYCDGDNVAEAIEELAAKDTGGFDWEIAPGGVFNTWVGGRGSASGQTIARADAQTWRVAGSASDLATYATALGEADEPCGPPLVTVSNALATTYKRREYTVDVSTTDSGEMTDAANNELKARARSRLRVHATFPEELMPWAWGDVWLGDTLTISLPAHYGGSQTFRTIEIQLYAEPPDQAWVEYEWEVI